MQTSQPLSAIQDFQTGIFSNDPVEYNAAINLYVEPNASYSSTLISTHGASKIKHIIALKKLLVREIREDKRKGSSSGGSKWDEDSQVYFVPTLTTFALPFTLPFIDVSFTFPTSLTLHLNVNEESDIESEEEDDGRYSQDDEAGGKGRQDGGEISIEGERRKSYVVTKWEERGPLDTIVGFGGKTIERLYYSFIRPMTTLAILLLAGTQHFINTHPLSDGVFNFVIAAIVTLITEARDIVLAELSSKHPSMVYHTDAYSKTAKSIHSAQSSVSSAMTSSSDNPRHQSPADGLNRRPQSPAGSVKSRTSTTRARFQPKASSSTTTSASNINATASPNGKHLNGDHPSYADVASNQHPSHIGAHTQTAGLGSAVFHHHEDHSASYAEVAAEGIVDHHDEHPKDD